MSANVLDIGITQEELREQVVERAAAKIADMVVEDAEYHGDLLAPVREMVRAGINAKVQEIAHETLAPVIGGSIESVVLQETNRWGEASGKGLTFREYLVHRAEQYMTEQVNYDGKPKGADSFSWKPAQTRIAHMIHEHLHYHIEQAMKHAVAEANGAIARGIHETVRLKLNEIAASLKVDIKTR